MRIIGLLKNRKVKTGLLLLIAAIVIFLWEYLLIEPQTAWTETVVESGCGGDLTFIASFPQINAIVPNNEDPLLEELLEAEHISVAVQILRQDGSVAGMAYGENIPVHTNGYISTESCRLAGLPIELNVGEQYTLHYEAVCGETGLPNLSFALYGTQTNLWIFGRGVTLAAVLLCIALFSLLWEEDKTARYFWFPFVWILLSVPYLWTMPLEQHDVEASHFARAYQLATGQSGDYGESDPYQPVTVQIPLQVEESGLRNMAYLSYSVPLYRFWTDRQYGNVRTQGMTGSQFRSPSADSDPGILLRAAAIAAARHFSFPYQAVYLSGAVVTAAVAILLMILILSRLREDHKAASFVMGLFLLPSFIRSILYYSGNGILILSLLLLSVLLYSRKQSGAQSPLIIAGKSTSHISRPGACVLTNCAFIGSVIIILWYCVSWGLADGSVLLQSVYKSGFLNAAADWAGNFVWYLNTAFLRLLYGTWTEKSHLMIPSAVFLWSLWKSTDTGEKEPLAVIAVFSFLVSLQYFL